MSTSAATFNPVAIHAASRDSQRISLIPGRQAEEVTTMRGDRVDLRLDTQEDTVWARPLLDKLHTDTGRAYVTRAYVTTADTNHGFPRQPLNMAIEHGRGGVRLAFYGESYDRTAEKQTARPLCTIELGRMRPESLQVLTFAAEQGPIAGVKVLRAGLIDRSADAATVDHYAQLGHAFVPVDQKVPDLQQVCFTTPFDGVSSRTQEITFAPSGTLYQES